MNALLLGRADICDPRRILEYTVLKRRGTTWFRQTSLRIHTNSADANEPQEVKGAKRTVGLLSWLKVQKLLDPA
jgi:hypothetical protein